MKSSLYLFLTFQLVWCQNAEKCLTPEGEGGICVPENVCLGYTSTSTEDTNANSDTCSNGITHVCCYSSRISPNIFREYSDDVDSSSATEAITMFEDETASSAQVLPESDTNTAHNQVIFNPAPKIANLTETSSVATSTVSSVTETTSVASSTVSSVKETTSVASSTESSVTESPTPSTASTEPSTTTSAPKLTEDDYETAFLEPPVCGNSQPELSKVVGGVDAKLGDFPWIGQIAYNVTGGFMFKCAGSLITSHHALTAAHCIYGMEDSIYFFRLGDLDTADLNETRPVDALVKVAIRHENYNTINYTNDIGILVFYRRVAFTELISPICLPVSSELRAKDFVGYNPFIAGWGRLKYKGPIPTRLQVLQLPVVSEEACKAAYASLIPIDHRDICVGGMGGKDACNGDSGGPLMQPIVVELVQFARRGTTATLITRCEASFVPMSSSCVSVGEGGCSDTLFEWDPVNYTTYFYQTGIVSLGVLCGTPGYPTVFTRVTEFIPWIQKIVLGK